MEEFSEEHHTKEDIRASLHEDSNILKKEESALLDLSLPNDYYHYRLRGVIVHSGTAESGHYISLVRYKDIWYEFNDARVSKFNVSRFAEDCFGGSTRMGVFGNEGKSEKNKNAYLLMYERVTHYDMKRLDFLSKEISTSQDMMRLSRQYEMGKLKDKKKDVRTSQIIQTNVEEKIKKHKLKLTLFNSDFLRFISHVIRNYDLEEAKTDIYSKVSSIQQNLCEVKEMPPELKSDAIRIETWKFFVHFFFTVLFRTKYESVTPLHMLLKKLKTALSNNISFSTWFVDTFTYPEVIREFLFDNPTSSTRLFIGSLLITACNKLKSIKYYTKIIDNLLKLLHDSMSIPKVFRDITYMLSMLTKSESKVAELLIQKGMIGICFERLLDMPGSCLASLKLITIQTPNEIPSLKFQRESFSTKKDSGVMRGSAKSLRFLFYLLSLLLSKQGVMPSGLTSDKIIYKELLTSEDKWELLLSKVDTDIARTSISKIFITLLSSDKKVTKEFISFLWIMIYKSNITSLATYILVMRDTILQQTTYDQEKYEKFLNSSIILIKKHLENSYVTYNYIIDLLIEISLCSKEFMMLFETSESKKLIMKWLSNNSYPSKRSVAWIEGPKTRIDITKPISEEDKKLCKEYSTLRFNMMKKSEYVPTPNSIRFIGERIKNLLETHNNHKLFDVK